MDQILAQIILWPVPWIPLGWLPCNGQLLPISQYNALFSLIGKTYGGDGVNNFALPNYNGKVSVGTGQLQGSPTSIYQLAQVGGAEGIALNINQMPVHNHGATTSLINGSVNGSLPAVTASASLAVSAQAGTTNTPNSINVPAAVPGIQVNATTTRPVNAYGTADGVTQWNVPVTAGYSGSSTLNLPVSGTQFGVSIGNNGFGNAHENRQPFLVLNYIIATEGTYPPQP